MKKSIILGIFLFIFSILLKNTTQASECNPHRYNEATYQHAWCKAHNGIEEYINNDRTRVDCLTEEYAVEFDFARKWAERIGQALHYQLMTGKKAKIVLILENLQKDCVYYNRVKKLSKLYNFEVESITPQDLYKLKK